MENRTNQPLLSRLTGAVYAAIGHMIRFLLHPLLEEEPPKPHLHVVPRPAMPPPAPPRRARPSLDSFLAAKAGSEPAPAFATESCHADRETTLLPPQHTVTPDDTEIVEPTKRRVLRERLRLAVTDGIPIKTPLGRAAERKGKR